jgi:hypothetical protein
MTEQATLAMLIDELPSHAISGKERTEGYSINGIGTAMPEEYQDLDAMRLDTLRRNLCVAVGRTEDENWKVVIGAPNLAAGSFRLHVTHRMETVDDEGDIAFREETYALHYRAMRFDERAFLDTFLKHPNTNHAKRESVRKPVNLQWHSRQSSNGCAPRPNKTAR